MEKQYDQNMMDELRLHLTTGVGPRTRQNLLEGFGDATSILAASHDSLMRVQGVGSKTADNLAKARQMDVQQEIDFCQAHGIDIQVISDPTYPGMLKEIPDPPGALFIRGTIEPCDRLAISIVGTRHATGYGLRQAERLAHELARAGLTIISGLARGIDAAAHRGALKAGGRTLAVLASGVLNIYPPEHHKLADEIIESGALVSESVPQAQPLAGMFPQRNRIVSGLSLGVIVVEAAERSGALITARHAMEQNREVMAVPGPVDSRMSRGAHRLLRDGAVLVESADDVLESLGPLHEQLEMVGSQQATTSPEGERTDNTGRTIRHPAELKLNEIETLVLDNIQTEATQIDTIMAPTNLSIERVLSTISVLEMRRLIRRVSGTTVVRI